ncbi:uncharacterized protein PGTG_07303 [Puccinia graminis f. sp. tritici CRL 75-36-700-3]|uniref:Uncharacterized protein n=1 Tax=Puccinia graminis f. sp. tritici (strain CRL 75-36-700-3 / race SCCL) TaxID=418459 RepID=E3K9A1_PUCGT|nr:uncharacterized protein PGTG_07303 [Puccinia graminis f. sp. tritici CRL 75-36-700-3]EFP81051.1 hypothetical protein PGTG_07303 [Puccinia graminis f. sp. tritici CRL 75-36-700-3]
MTNRKRHCISKRHQSLVQEHKERRMERDSQRAAALVVNEEAMDIDQTTELAPDGNEHQTLTEDTFRDVEIQTFEDPEEVPLSQFEEEDSDNEEGELQWTDMIEIAVGQINSEPEEAALAATDPLFRREEAEIAKIRPDNSAWYPFLNKEYLVGSLLIGYLHKLISRDMYHQIRIVFTLYHVRIPRWEADLMNPLVASHLEFVPEEAHGYNIFKLSQSSKWLKDFKSDLRVQMVESNTKHFYLFEPVQLESYKIVIPIFFYTENGALFTKCYKPTIKTNPDHSAVEIHLATNPTEIPYDDITLQTLSVKKLSVIYQDIKLKNGLKLSECCGNNLIIENSSEISLPNPWRKKSAGKILRNVPITLYCDDTSGNKSKKWNKHISYYFTLSGLPPKISNQQFNCHFLCTSNIVGALELGEMVVEQLNDMAINGFEAYDCTIDEEVHVMTSLMCFTADSPMHAEITNTHVPGNSLNSCRYCTLSSPTLADRKKIPYVGKFVQKNSHGSNCPNNLRTMEQTIENSKKLWTFAKKPLTNLEKLNTESAKLAFRDQMNLKFCKQLFEFESKKIATLEEDGELPPEMDQPIPQTLVDLEEKEPDRMFNRFLDLRGFDMVKDTPVEALHVILLGAVKYLFQDFMKGLDEDQEKELLALWYSFNTNSLNIPSIRPTSLSLFFDLARLVFLQQKNLKVTMVFFEMLQSTPTVTVLAKI